PTCGKTKLAAILVPRRNYGPRPDQRGPEALQSGDRERPRARAADSLRASREVRHARPSAQSRGVPDDVHSGLRIRTGKQKKAPRRQETSCISTPLNTCLRTWEVR